MLRVKLFGSHVSFNSFHTAPTCKRKWRHHVQPGDWRRPAACQPCLVRLLPGSSLRSKVSMLNANLTNHKSAYSAKWHFDTWLLIVFQSEHLTSETSLSLCHLQAKAPSWTGTVPPQGVASSGKAHNMNEKSWNYNWCKMLSSLCLQIAAGPSPTFPIPGFHRMNGLATQHLTQNSRMQRSEALISFLMLSAWVQKASTWYKVFLQNACCVNFFTYHTIPYRIIPYHIIPHHYTTLHYTTLQYVTLHYTTLHYITVHKITLQYIPTVPYDTIPLHYLTLLYFPSSQYIPLHYSTLHCITVHYILYYYTLHCTTLH